MIYATRGRRRLEDGTSCYTESRGRSERSSESSSSRRRAREELVLILVFLPSLRLAEPREGKAGLKRKRIYLAIETVDVGSEIMTLGVDTSPVQRLPSQSLQSSRHLARHHQTLSCTSLSVADLGLPDRPLAAQHFLAQISSIGSTTVSAGWRRSQRRACLFLCRR